MQKVGMNWICERRGKMYERRVLRDERFLEANLATHASGRLK